jgi:hypothetical protein
MTECQEESELKPAIDRKKEIEREKSQQECKMSSSNRGVLQ